LPVDLVYNRLTDFTLAAPENAQLRAAYLARAVVLTPHDRYPKSVCPFGSIDSHPMLDGELPLSKICF
jgi:hypothetical protein